MSTVSVQQALHGIEVTSHPVPVYRDTSGVIQLAKADSVDTTATMFVVASTESSLSVMIEGVLNFENNLNPGHYYFLSEIAAGGISEHPGIVSQPLIYCINQQKLSLKSYRPFYCNGYKILEG